MVSGVHKYNLFLQFFYNYRISVFQICSSNIVKYKYLYFAILLNHLLGCMRISKLANYFKVYVAQNFEFLFFTIFLPVTPAIMRRLANAVSPLSQSSGRWASNKLALGEN